MSIELGNKVRDKVTGLVGVAENRATYMFGCDRYWLQPLAAEDGSIPKGMMVDAPQLQDLEVQVMEPMPEAEQIIEMGQEVTDKIIGVKGVAIGRSVYLNGCSRICVQPKSKDGRTVPDNFWVDEKQLEGKRTYGGRASVPTSPDTAQARNTGGPAPSCSKY